MDEIIIRTGNRVCLTKIACKNNIDIQPGEKSHGELVVFEEGRGIRIDAQQASDEGIQTSHVEQIYTSYNCAMIKTENSLYLLERLS